MRNLVGLACFLGICIASVHSTLNCTKCTNLSGLDCKGDSVECSDEDVCTASYYEEKIGDNVKNSWVVKGCGSKKECINAGVLTNRDQKLVVVTGVSCCNETNCVIQVEVPAESTKENNLTCRSCYSTSSDQCYTDDTILCTGNENRCARFRVEVEGDNTYNFNTRGCATEEFCKADVSAMKTLKMTTDKACTDSGLHLQRNLFLLWASLICLAKLI